MILPDRATAERARALLGPVTAAYRHYDHPAGPGLFGTQSIFGVREVGSLWHPPSARDETPPVERSGAKVFLPSSRGVRGGVLVGSTTAGRPREIRFPADLLRHHHLLYVARTRMGKSTLMHHIIVHKMREKAAGRDDDAIVVVDPHVDLVAGLLEHVPASLANGMCLIDLADRSRSVGINLLDTRVFADRDRTADSMVRVTQGGCGGKDAAVRRAGLPDAVWRAEIDAHPRKAAVSRLDGRGRGADGEGLLRGAEARSRWREEG